MQSKLGDRLGRVSSRGKCVSVVAVTGVVAVAAVGSSSAIGRTSKAASANTDVTLSYIVGADNGPILFAQSKGFFAKNHLTVKLTTNDEGGAIEVPQLLSNHAQIADMGTTDFYEAESKGFKLSWVGEDDVSPPSASAPDATAIIALKSSPLKNCGQLAGKTVGVNSLKSLGQLFVEANVNAKGGNWHSVKYAAVNFPNIGSALSSNTIVAGWTVNPFLVSDLASGDKVLCYGSNGLGTGVPVSGWVTSAKYSAANPTVIKEFAKAWDEGYAYGKANPGALRTLLSKTTGIPAKTVKTMTLLSQSTNVTEAKTVTAMTQLKKYGISTGTLPPASAWYKAPSAS